MSLCPAPDLGQTAPPEIIPKGRVMLIACGALAREILAITKGHGWDHMDLTCLPAILHNSPDKITDAVRSCVAKYSDTYRKIFIV